MALDGTRRHTAAAAAAAVASVTLVAVAPVRGGTSRAEHVFNGAGGAGAVRARAASGLRDSEHTCLESLMNLCRIES